MNRPPVGYACPHSGHNMIPLSPHKTSFVKQSEAMPKAPLPPPQNKELGDQVEKALTMIGITSQRVEQWMGRPCGCLKRKEKLNQLSRHVKRILRGEPDMKQHLEDLITEG